MIEIDRIIKELEDCEDIQKCLNIMCDLDEVVGKGFISAYFFHLLIL